MSVARRCLSLGLFVALGCGDDAPPHEHDGGHAGDGGHEELDGGVALDAGIGDPPATLAETGLYSDFAARTLAPGVIAYTVDHELWSDGAEKRRFLLLPEGTSIDTSDMDDWVFPIGTRVWKEFHRDGVHVETRFMEKRAEGGDSGWIRIAYVWSADGTEALPAPDGVEDGRGTPHDVPSVVDCRQCHRGGFDNLLGVSALQIAAPGGLLDRLQADGRLTAPPATRPTIPGSGETFAALAYMHANCGHCHGEHHPLARIRAMRLYVPVGLTSPEDAPVYRTAVGAMAGHLIDGSNTIIVPGDPMGSQLFNRITRRDKEQMPPLGTEVADPTGSETIRLWIEGLAAP
jgi:hypothetical protein